MLLKTILIIPLIGIILHFMKIYYFAGCTCKSENRLDGKTVVLTGGNTGIGIETVKILLNRGANVISTSRDKSKCSHTISHVGQEIGDEAKSRLKCVILDLSSRASIENAAKEILSITKNIHILINNAAVMALNDYTKTKEGFEMQFGVNHLGHFLLTHLLMPRLLESTPARVVSVSSLGHMFYKNLDNFTALNDPQVYSKWVSYGDSKAANLLHMQSLSKKYKDKGITAVSLHPGSIATDLQRHMNVVLQFLFNLAQSFMVKTPWEGCQTTVHCAIDDSVPEHSGEYYSDCQPKIPWYFQKDDPRGEKLWKFSEEFWNIKA